MNANELADELKKCIKDGSTDLVCVDKAATMLRQQQAEIEALKQIIDANNLSQNIGQFRKAQEK
jgi:RecA/RadA recombinase